MVSAQMRYMPEYIRRKDVFTARDIYTSKSQLTEIVSMRISMKIRLLEECTRTIPITRRRERNPFSVTSLSMYTRQRFSSLDGPEEWGRCFHVRLMYYLNLTSPR